MTSASVFPDSDELESELTNTDLTHDHLPNDDGSVADAISDALAGTAGPDTGAAESAIAQVVASVSIPDRADAPVSEITERFFKAIVAKVPVDRIEELHLFAPLRQGGVETGIAVIAARVIVPVAPAAPLPDTPLALPLATTLDEPVAESAAEPQDVTEGESVDTIVPGIDGSPTDESARTMDEAPATGILPDATESPYAPEILHEIVVDATLQSMTETAGTAAVVERHTVYTARYRLVQKGAERGKWEASVVDEADAPLITVEMVVRGVQRRAGEASATTRYTGAQIARALRLQQGS